MIGPWINNRRFVVQRDVASQSDFETKFILRCSGFWSIETCTLFESIYICLCLEYWTFQNHVTWSVGRKDWSIVLELLWRWSVVANPFENFTCEILTRRNGMLRPLNQVETWGRLPLTRIIRYISNTVNPNYFDMSDWFQWQVSVHKDMSKLEILTETCSCWVESHGVVTPHSELRPSKSL